MAGPAGPEALSGPVRPRWHFPALLVASAALVSAARADEPPPLTAETIDREVDAALAAAGIEPSPPTDGRAFTRRLWLELLGRTPPLEAIQAPPAGEAARAQMIGRLLETPEAARRAAAQWTAELFDRPGGQAGAQLLQDAFRDWLAGELAADRPWDQLVAAILAGEGRTDQQPALTWALLRSASGDPADLAGPALRQFLGLQLECARCHDHPFQRWTQAEFQQVTAWFARTRVRPEPGLLAVYRFSEAPLGEHRATLGGHKQEVAPGFPSPGGGADALPAEGPALAGATPPGVTRTSRRAAFARWVTAPANPWFARAAVNRVWARRFGAPLVAPLDDLEAAGDAPLAGLLDRLAAAFAADGFSLRRLDAAILGSRAWQRSALRAGDPVTRERARALAGTARVRPLDAPTLAGALLAVAGRDRPGPGEPPRLHAALRARLELELGGVLPPSGAARDPDQVTTAQGLVTLVGPALTGLVRGPLVARVLEGDPATPEALRRLWLLALSRPPSPAESSRARAHLGAHPAREAWEDLAWALIAGSEFHTNH